MKAIFNSRIIDTSKPLILTSNRAFCYGDGLFETIVTGPDRIDLIDWHLERLLRASAVYGMKAPEVLTPNYVRDSIEQLCKENAVKGATRTKLIVWRNEGGLYAPEQNSCGFLLECKPSHKPFFEGLDTIGLSQTITTRHTLYSFAKRTNAIDYVLAGKERAENEWDEIVLLSTEGHLAEASMANLFWIANGELFTPSLDTGCIEGIMRRAVLEKAEKAGMVVNEVKANLEVLPTAQCIFTTNASGIRYYSHVMNSTQRKENPLAFLKPILTQLLRP